MVELIWDNKQEMLAETNSEAFQQTDKKLIPCIEESKNFDNTDNLYIEGDNLDALKLLKKNYENKIKMIYIDPPYNTEKKFMYNDTFRNKKKKECRHSGWLNMIYPRLKLARDLLTDDGVIFISIDDNEVENLKKVCNEVLGAGNFVAEFTRVTKKAGKSTDKIAKNNDYLLCYQKSKAIKLYPFLHDDDGFKFSDEFENERGKYKLNQTLDYNTLGYVFSLDYPIAINGNTFYAGGVDEFEYMKRKNDNPKDGFRWRWSKELFDFGLANGFVVVKEYDSYSRIYTKTYQNATIEKNTNGDYFVDFISRVKPLSSLEFIDNKYSNDNAKKGIDSVLGSNMFDYSKPLSLLQCISAFSTRENDIILDFFSGSATTAHAVMQLNAEDGGNRKFIMVQLPEETDEKSEAFKVGYKNICEIGKERIRRAGEKIKADKPDTVFDDGFKVYKIN